MSHDKILHVPKEVVKALTEAAEMTDTVNPVVAGFAKRAEAALALQKGRKKPTTPELKPGRRVSNIYIGESSVRMSGNTPQPTR